MSMGLTLTYMTTKVPNFAYGDFILIGVYSAYVSVKLYHSNPYVGSALGFVVAGLVSVAMYLGVLRPLARRGASIVSLMIATFGFDIGMTGIFGIFTDYLQYVDQLKDAKGFYQLGPDFTLGGFRGIVFAAPGAMILAVLIIYLLFTKTKFGVAMRAAIENPPLARTLGINVDMVYTMSWMLAGGFAGFAGAFLTLQLPGNTNTGNDLIVQIFAASVLGGLTSIFGSAVGGLIVGGSSILVTIWLGLGFGVPGTVVLALIIVALGAYLFRKERRRTRIGGVVLVALGAWIVADLALGTPIGFLVPQLVSGFGPNVTPYQLAIPLLIMAGTLMVIPEGIFSLDFKRFLNRKRK